MCADAAGPSGAGPSRAGLAARHVATLDVLLKEMLTERSTAAAAAPFTVADAMARLARANLSFPEDAVVQVCAGEHGDEFTTGAQHQIDQRDRRLDLSRSDDQDVDTDES